MNRKLTTTILLATSVLVLGACGGEEEEVEPLQEDTGTVVVNNGEVETEDEDDVEEEIVVPEREVYEDTVPKTDRDKIVQDSIKSEIPYSDNMEDTSPDLTVEYLEVNDSQPETVDFNVPYTLYYTDSNDRSVGGEGVVTYTTKGDSPEEERGSETKLYEMELLSTSLIKDERGLEGRNKALVTKQAYNLITELNNNIYETARPEVTDNSTYIRVETLYQGEEDIPYGIHYQAQSIHGDVKFNYIINNIQNGYEVDYNNGTVKAGGLVE